MTTFLERFTNVRRNEVAALFASIAFFFFVLAAIQMLRPAREALGMQSGLDTVRWLFVGTAVVTLAVNPAFGWLVAKFRRITFIALTYTVFAASLVGFWGLLAFAPERAGEISGRVFYVWFSVFNLFTTMVFWALMADRFSLEQSKRLFGVLAVGGTLGAIAGPAFAWAYAERVGTPGLLLIAAGLLMLGVVAAKVVTWLQPESLTEVDPNDPEAPPVVDDRSIIGGSMIEGFRAVVRSRFLLGICAWVLIMAILATFIYFTRLAMVAALTEEIDTRTGIFAQIDTLTQVATFFLQLFLTGHIMKRLGVGVALVLLPVTVSLGFIGLAISGSFAALVILEASYRAVQRGIARPARETLFTVVSREDKYKAKAVIDTFVYRAGDVTGAWTEGALVKLGGGVAALTTLVLPIAAVWAGLSIWLARAQTRIAKGGADADSLYTPGDAPGARPLVGGVVDE
jgi:AAA family ATP:ADP antiporter